MKKFFSILMAVLLLSAMSVAVFADDDFVPSIGHDTTDPDEGSGIIITHYDDIHGAHPEVDKEDFQDAFDELAGADPLDSLNDDIKDGAVVRDLYDITLIDDALDELEKNGKVTVTLDAGLSDDNYQVIFRGDNGWEIINNVVRNLDGSLTFDITGEGQVAILTYKPAPQGGVQTSDPITAILGCLILVTLAGGAVIYTRKKLAK